MRLLVSCLTCSLAGVIGGIALVAAVTVLVSKLRRRTTLGITEEELRQSSPKTAWEYLHGRAVKATPSKVRVLGAEPGDSDIDTVQSTSTSDVLR